MPTPAVFEPEPKTLRDRAREIGHYLARSWSGRLLSAGALIKGLFLCLDLARVPVSTGARFVSTLGGLAIAVALLIGIVQIVQLARQGFLWRVRRKLIVSYVFIGVVPVILVAVFFLLAGRLLFNNLSSYLIQGSVREMAADAHAMARTAAFELGPERQAAATREYIRHQIGVWRTRYPGVSVAYVATAPGRCPDAGAVGAMLLAPVGTWRHTPVPTAIPAWVTCQGFAGVLTLPSGPNVSAPLAATIRAIEMRDGGAVVVDLPIDQAVRNRIAGATGVAVGGFSLDGDGAAPHAALGAEDTGPEAVTRMHWVAMVDQVSWTTGAPSPLHVQIGFNIHDIYERLSESQALLGDFLGALLMFIAGLFLIIEIGALLMGLTLARSITGSVHELFVGTERVRRGDFTHRISVHVKDQLGALADSFNQMTASIEDLLRQAAEKKRLEEEMRLAREIQMSLLPPGPLTVPGMDVAALCVPAREVGGDYYDVLRLPGGLVGVLIADVAGKGMSAALYMAELKGLMLSLTRMYRSPRELLLAANRLMSEHLDSRSFITMSYAVIDPDTCTMVYARAGHTPLIHVPASASGEGRANILTPDGMVVGLHLDNGERFEQILTETTVHLTRGDVLAFFTDGISEAMNGESDCFGEPRLAHLLETHADQPVDVLRERILREIDAFVGGAPQHDDMTMILLKVGNEVCPSPS